MSIKSYFISLSFTVCGLIIQRYYHDELPLPVVGYQFRANWLFPPHCMLFTAALVETWLNIEIEA
jgi:hypothetical protein